MAIPHDESYQTELNGKGTDAHSHTVLADEPEPKPEHFGYEGLPERAIPVGVRYRDLLPHVAGYTTPTLKQLFAAMSRAQAAISSAAADAENPHFKAKYATLKAIWDAVREPLTSNGLSVIQEPMGDNDGWVLSTTLGHESGEYMTSYLPMPIPAAKAGNPQELGKFIAYWKRYALAAVTGCGVADPDLDAEDPKEVAAANKQVEHQAAVREHWSSVAAIKEHLGAPEPDYYRAAEAYYELDQETQIALTLAPSKGGIFTTAEIKAMRSDDWSKARAEVFGADGE